MPVSAGGPVPVVVAGLALVTVVPVVAAAEPGRSVGGVGGPGGGGAGADGRAWRGHVASQKRRGVFRATERASGPKPPPD